METLDEAARRRAITWAMRLTVGTPLAPDLHERDLLEAYARGMLSLEQLLYFTDHQRWVLAKPAMPAIV